MIVALVIKYSFITWVTNNNLFKFSFATITFLELEVFLFSFVSRFGQFIAWCPCLPHLKHLLFLLDLWFKSKLTFLAIIFVPMLPLVTKLPPELIFLVLDTFFFYFFKFKVALSLLWREHFYYISWYSQSAHKNLVGNTWK